MACKSNQLWSGFEWASKLFLMDVTGKSFMDNSVKGYETNWEITGMQMTDVSSQIWLKSTESLLISLVCEGDGGKNIFFSSTIATAGALLSGLLRSLLARNHIEHLIAHWSMWLNILKATLIKFITTYFTAFFWFSLKESAGPCLVWFSDDF